MRCHPDDCIACLLAGDFLIIHDEKWIEERLAGILEGHTVLGQVGRSLLTVPLKVDALVGVSYVMSETSDSVYTMSMRITRDRADWPVVRSCRGTPAHLGYY